MRTTIKGLGVVLLAAAVVGSLWVRFAHPYLTDTQMFVEFWWAWLVITAAAVTGTILSFR